MNDKCIKIGYLSIGIVTLVFYGFVLVNRTVILEFLDTYTLIVLLIAALIPFFAFKFIYEQKNISQHWLILGYAIILVMILYCGMTIIRLYLNFM